MAIVVIHDSGVGRVNAISIGEIIRATNCNPESVHALAAERLGDKWGIFRFGGFERFAGYSCSAIIEVDSVRYIIFRFP